MHYINNKDLVPTVFGLGSAVWTEDAAEQELFVRELEAGQVFVNGMVDDRLDRTIVELLLRLGEFGVVGATRD